MIKSHRQQLNIPAYSVSMDRWKDFDPILFITVLVLMGFGIVSIWSAIGMPPLLSNNEGTKQAAYGLIGICLMLIFSAIDYRYLDALAWPLYGFGIFLLLLVQSPLGVTVSGSQNWLNIGFTLIQPNEFTKITTILALSSFVAAQGEAMKQFSNFIIAGLIVALPTLLILIGPDLGQAMVYLAFWAATLVVMRTHKALIALTLISAPFLAVLAWHFVLQDYQKTRFLVSYWPERDPLDKGFQIIQARTAIGAGGLWGEGITGGTQSTRKFLGVTESDFIFAHASGMFGFIGMLGLMVAMAILLWRCLIVAEVSRDHLGQMFAIAVTGAFFFQAVLNIGMNVGLMPVSGITLPLVSAGISSLWSSMILLGIMQSIRMHHRKLGFQPL
ncbi:MAG TPA: FtsW/RodA/SpoVE family cell cycle protein [Thermomicrobiales bacterium]|nr:FtsW/RodA/SpoVE family cell cycle protein [Thermomicrobiales bacterium]